MPTHTRWSLVAAALALVAVPSGSAAQAAVPGGRVESAEDASGATAGPVAVAAPAADRPWTFLVYGAADNDADGHMFRFIDDVRAALAAHEGVEVILFMDRHRHHSNDATVLGEDFTGARLYRLTGGASERLAGGELFPEVRLVAEWEADSGDPAVLGSFLRFGKAHYPARHTGLLIYSHADGITMCPDDATDTEMDLATFPGRVGADCSVDWTGLELCTMGGFEIAWSWRPGSGGFATDVLVAIPNAGPALDWAAILRDFRPQMTPADLGRLAVERGGAARRAAAAADPEHAEMAAFESVAAYDLRLADAAKRAWDAFAVALAGVEGARDVLTGLRGRGRDAAINYVRGTFDDERAFVDAVDLLRRAEGSARLPEPARAAAKAAREALDAMVLASFAMDGYAGFVPGENGIFVTFPDGAEALGFFDRRPVWALYGWYAATPFARDGATPGDGAVSNWFELLDAWFDTPADGGVNGTAP